MGVCGGGAGFLESWRQDTTCSRRGNFSACWCRVVGIEGGRYHGWVSRNVGNAHIADHLDLIISRLPPFVSEVVRALGANPRTRPPSGGQGVFNCLGGARWAPTPLNPPPSGRRAGECAMRAATCRRHADTQRPLGQESGSAGVPSTSGWSVVKGARRGKSSRSAGQSSRDGGALRAAPGVCLETSLMFGE